MIECRQILNKDVTSYELPRGLKLKHVEERGVNFCLIYEREENETEVEVLGIQMHKQGSAPSGGVEIPFSGNSEGCEFLVYEI